MSSAQPRDSHPHLQLVEEGPDGCVAQPAHTAQVADNTRLEADQRLMGELRLGGFQGPAYELFEAELAAYAFPVLMSWMHSGKIFQECVLKGRPVPVETARLDGWQRWDRDDQVEIANLTIAYALKYLREKVLIPGKWDPAYGATIKTYFIGTCTLQFPNQFVSVMTGQLRWDRTHSPQAQADAVAQLRMPSSAEHDPERAAVIRRTIIEVMGTMDHELRTAALLISRGHTYAEAAEELGISAAALSERFRRFRRRNHRPGSGGQDE